MASEKYLMDILSMLLKYHDKIGHSVEDVLNANEAPAKAATSQETRSG